MVIPLDEIFADLEAKHEREAQHTGADLAATLNRLETAGDRRVTVTAMKLIRRSGQIVAWNETKIDVPQQRRARAAPDLQQGVRAALPGGRGARAGGRDIRPADRGAGAMEADAQDAVRDRPPVDRLQGPMPVVFLGARECGEPGENPGLTRSGVGDKRIAGPLSRVKRRLGKEFRKVDPKPEDPVVSKQPSRE